MADKNTFLEKIHQHLFSDDEVNVKIFTKPEQDMIHRYRAVFTKWLDDWQLSDKEMCTYIMKEYGMSKTIAYKDISNIKHLLGNIEAAGKEFQRYRATEMIMQAYKLANDAETKLEVLRAESLIKAATAMVKIHKLNLSEADSIPWDKIIPANFEVTGDVSVLGITPIENLKELQAKLRAKYNQMPATKIEDVPFEDVSHE
jgi:hypothetical protein